MSFLSLNSGIISASLMVADEASTQMKSFRIIVLCGGESNVFTILSNLVLDMRNLCTFGIAVPFQCMVYQSYEDPRCHILKQYYTLKIFIPWELIEFFTVECFVQNIAC